MLRRQRLFILAGALLTVSLAPSVRPAAAGEVTEQLKLDVDRVFGTLEGRRGGGSPDVVRDATAGMFDWNEMAHRMLGAHWDVRTESEREEFVRLLGGLVQTQIVALRAVRGEAIQYVGESVERDRATVETRIPRGPGHELELDYMLVRRDGRWRVVDVLVNHASLLEHYRAQFRRIIKTASYEGLIAKLSAR